MGKPHSKITFFLFTIVALLISTMVISDSYGKLLPRNNEPSLKNPIALYSYRDFFVKDDILYFDDNNDHIIMMDVEDVNIISKIEEYNTHSYNEIINFDSYIIGVRKGDNFEYDFNEYTLEILSIINKTKFTLQGEMTFMTEDSHLSPNMNIFTDNRDNIFCSLFIRDQSAIYAVNCTNPTSPYLAANYSKTILEVKGDDFIRKYRIHESYLYTLIADYDDFNCTISTYNITNPLVPVKINDLSFPADYDLSDFFIDYSIIYCYYDIDGYTHRNLAIYDINNRTNPQLIDEMIDINKTNSMIFHGDYVYLNDWSCIHIFEKKTDKTLEYKEVFYPEIKNRFHDYLGRGKLYDNDKIFYSRSSSEPTRTFTIIDIKNPLNPVEIQVFGLGDKTFQAVIEFNWIVLEIFLVSIVVLTIRKKKERFEFV